MVAIHEVYSIRDIKLSDQDFIFRLHHVSMLIFDYIADLAYLTFTWSPDLDQALSVDLIS